jgi:hypothetical protein
MIHRSFSPLFVALSFSAIGAAAALAACSSDPAPAGDAGADAIASDASSTDGSTNPDTSTANDASATDATTSDGGLSPTEKAICDAKASRAKCFDGSGGDPNPCSEETKCLYGRLMEPAAVTAYAACHGFPSCTGDDRCIAQAGEAVGGQAARDYTTACLAKVTECGAAFPDDELCSPAAFAYKGIGAGAAACLAKPCADQKACFDAILAPIVACKQL